MITMRDVDITKAVQSWETQLFRLLHLAEEDLQIARSVAEGRRHDRTRHIQRPGKRSIRPPNFDRALRIAGNVPMRLAESSALLWVLGTINYDERVIERLTGRLNDLEVEQERLVKIIGYLSKGKKLPIGLR